VIEEVKKRLDDEVANVLAGATVDLESAEITAMNSAYRSGFIQGLNYFLSLGEDDE